MATHYRNLKFTRRGVIHAGALFLFPIILVFMLDSILMAIQPYYWFKFTTTPSLPGYIYLVMGKEAYTCGDTVAFVVPKGNPYFPERHWIKKLMGCPGDVISHKGRSILINGVLAGDIKRFSFSGKPLFRIQDGVIPKGKFYAWAPHFDSYDSRYASLGLIDKKAIFGKAVKLW